MQQTKRTGDPRTSGVAGTAAAAVPAQPRAIHAGILLVTSGLTTLVTAVIGPSLPRMQAHFATAPGADYLVPLTMTAPMLVMALLSIVMGGLADRFGRKRILVTATTLYALVGTAPLWLDRLSAIFASRVLLGVCEAALMTVSTTMIGDYFEGHRREKFMALQTTVASSSAFVLNLLGGAIGEFGWRAPYAVYGVSLVLAALMAIYLWEPRSPADHARVDAAVAADPPGEFKGSNLALICAVGALAGLVFLIVPVHLGYLFAALGEHSTSAIGVAYGLNSLGVVTGTVVFGWVVARRCSVPAQIAIAALITGLGFGGMWLATGYASLTAAAIVNGLGAGILLPTVVTWNMRDLPFARRGFGVGAFQSCLYFGMFSNPILVVGLDGRLGSRAAAVGVVGAGMIAMAAAAGLLANRSRSAARVAMDGGQ